MSTLCETLILSPSLRQQRWCAILIQSFSSYTREKEQSETPAFAEAPRDVKNS